MKSAVHKLSGHWACDF